MKKTLHYNIFKNNLGYMALVFYATIIKKIYLPFNNINQLKKKILTDFPDALPMIPTQKIIKLMHKINTHLDGEIQTYHEFKIDLCKLTPFQQSTLLAAGKNQGTQKLSCRWFCAFTKSPPLGYSLSPNCIHQRNRRVYCRARYRTKKIFTSTRKS